MPNNTPIPDNRFFKTTAGRCVLFVLIGVAVLLLKPHYHGPYADLVHAYAGNISISFAVYFIVRVSAERRHLGRMLTAVIALSVVELFEATDGFGVMSNVYDPLDFVANAVGVGIAVTVDWLVDKRGSGNAKQ